MGTLTVGASPAPQTSCQRETSERPMTTATLACNPTPAGPITAQRCGSCGRGTKTAFIWTTRHGIGAGVRQEHWGCSGSLVIAARLEPWLAEPLVADPRVSASIDELARRGGPLQGSW